MDFEQYLDSVIDDEDIAENKYVELLDALDKDNNIDISVKCLIAGMIYKIQTDEQTHYNMLNIIKEVINN